MYLRYFLCLLILISYVNSSSAQEASEGNWFSRDHLLGDFSKARHFLEDHGIKLDFVYTGEVLWNTHGGINTNDSDEYRGDLSL